jgi:hypothetical protein
MQDINKKLRAYVFAASRDLRKHAGMFQKACKTSKWVDVFFAAWRDQRSFALW